MLAWSHLGGLILTLGLPGVSTQKFDVNQVRGDELFIDQFTGTWKYPSLKRDESVVDSYYGVDIKDPYRNLENHLDPKTVEFERVQTELAERFVAKEASRGKIEARMFEMNNYLKYNGWQYINGTLYALYNPGKNEQFNLIKGTPNGFETVFNVELEYERPYSAIRAIYPSPDGRYIAFKLYRKGSDWQEIRVIMTDAKNTLLPTKILYNWGDEGINWTSDSTGFYYSNYRPPKTVTPDQLGLETDTPINIGIALHKLFTRSPDTQIIDLQKQTRMADGNENLNGGSEYREIDKNSGIFIVNGSRSNGYKSKIFVHNATNRASTLVEVLPQYPGKKKTVVGNRDGLIYIVTDIDASNNRLIAVDTKDVNTIIPLVREYLDKILNTAYMGKSDKLILYYERDGLTKLELYSLKSLQQLDTIPIEFGFVYGFNFNTDETEFTYRVGNFLAESQQFTYNFSTRTNRMVGEEKIPKFNSQDYVQKSATYLSKDGQDIPVIYVHKRGLQPNGKNLVLLKAYGGFDSLTYPHFDLLWGYLLENENAVIALPVIRGNSDRGKGWWHAGRYLNKQKSYDDMAAAVDFFQNNPETKFGSPATTFIHGVSNGGLMAAAVCNQIPEKLAGCFPEAGVHDLIRFPLFTVGFHWKSEYGDIKNGKTDLDNILKFSPLHNVLPSKPKGQKTYPHLWITTGEYDDRVSKLHSFKLAATIQNSHKFAQNPAFLYIIAKSGHGSGRPQSIDIKDKVNKIAFMKLAMKDFHARRAARNLPVEEVKKN